MKALLPFKNSILNVLVGGLAFVLGFSFDLTVYRLDSMGIPMESGPFVLAGRVLSGLVLGVILLALLRAGRDLKGLARVNRGEFLLLFLLLNAFTALYAFTSKTVYIWDNAGYWVVAQTLAEQPLNSAQILEVLKSTISMDYNYLLAWPVSLVMRVFGGSRTVFLFALSNLYTLPGLWALCALTREKKWGGLMLAGLCPMLVYVGLVGYVDVAVAALGLWAYIVYTSDRPPVSRGIVSGALLVGTFLLRRYFFFFAASFGVAALAVKLLFERKTWSDFLSLFLSCAVCSAFFTPNFILEKVLGTNYAALYSAYSLGLKSDFLLLFRYFGLLTLAILLVCAVGALNKNMEKELVFALIQPAVCFVAFVCVQSHGQQHLLMYFPAVAFLAAHVLLSKTTLTGLLAGVTLLGCLIPGNQPASVEDISYPDALPSFDFYGPRRADIEELVALSDFVNSLSAEGQKRAVVLSSSFIFTGETLLRLHHSLGLPEPAVETVIQSHGTVDKRDAFNWNTAFADYLIIGDPVQTHLGEENQQVMALLAHDVLTGTGVGSIYSPLPETFSLSDSVTVRIYRRERDWWAEDFHSVSDRLTALYPDYADHYAVPDWIE